MEKPAPNGYYDRNNYLSRLSIVQEQIYWSLLQNDFRFGGDDDIHAVLVFGSYADSFFRAEGSSVRKPFEGSTGSDLDFLTFESNIGHQSIFARLSPLDKLLAREMRPFPVEEFMKTPLLRLRYLLRRNLRVAGLDIITDIPGLEINLNGFSEMEANLLGNNGPAFRINHGLLFAAESPFMQKVIDIVRQSKVPTVLNPATRAIRL